MKIIAVLIGILLIGGVYGVLVLLPEEEFIVKKQDITKQIIVSGTAIPAENIDLSFPIDGMIASVAVRVGDHVESGALLAELVRSRKEAEIKQYEAKIAVEKEKLSQVLSGVGRREIDLFEAKVAAASTALDNARKESENITAQTNNELFRRYALAREYGETITLNAENAMKALDGIYDDKNAFRSIFIIPGSRERSDAEWQMSLSRTVFSNIKTECAKLKTDGSYDVIDAALAGSKTNLEVIRATLSKTAELLNGAEVQFGAPDVGGFITTMMVQRSVINATQTVILTHEQDVAAQKIINQTAVNEADKKISEAAAALAVAEGELAVKRSVSADAAIAMHQALIKEYESSLAVISDDLENGALRSPTDGVIARIAARPGTAVKRQAAVITLAPIGDTQVDVGVSEGDTPFIRIGDSARFSVGGVMRDGKVVAISGDTVRVHIGEIGGESGVSQEVSGVLDAVVKQKAILVPSSFINKEDGMISVRVKGAEGVRTLSVLLGVEWNGFVEITEGVVEGDVIVRPSRIW